MDDYSNAQYERKEHGAILLDGIQVATTKQCPHCGGHFISFRGSGKRRALCFKCQAVTCGRPACDKCYPWEKQMDDIERRLNHG